MGRGPESDPRGSYPLWNFQLWLSIPIRVVTTGRSCELTTVWGRTACHHSLTKVWGGPRALHTTSGPRALLPASGIPTQDRMGGREFHPSSLAISATSSVLSESVLFQKFLVLGNRFLCNFFCVLRKMKTKTTNFTKQALMPIVITVIFAGFHMMNF